MAERVSTVSAVFPLMHTEQSLTVSKGGTLSQYSIPLKVQESFPSWTHHLLKFFLNKVVPQAIRAGSLLTETTRNMVSRLSVEITHRSNPCRASRRCICLQCLVDKKQFTSQNCLQLFLSDPTFTNFFLKTFTKHIQFLKNFHSRNYNCPVKTSSQTWHLCENLSNIFF